MKRKSDANSQHISHTKKQRSHTLIHELKRFGKVGGVFDKRYGVRDKNTTDEHKALRRHIVEKLRHLSSVPYDKTDESDPLIIAALNSGRSTEIAKEPDIDGGISGNIVEEEFFTGGVDSEKAKGDFKDVLAEKIAVTRLERLKRVEENESQREKLKSADSQWNKSVRFMLDKFPQTKVKIASENQRKNRQSVTKLLDELTSDKQIVPIGSNVVHSEEFLENQLIKLESLVEGAPLTNIESDHTQNQFHPEKATGHLLRILLQLPSQQQYAVVFLSDQLSKATFRGLKDVIHYLYFIQLLVDHFQMKFKQDNEEKIIKSNEIGNSSFCSELVHAMTRMLQLASSVPNPQQSAVSYKALALRKQMTNIDAYRNLDIRLADPSERISHDQIPTIRLACMERLLCLILQLYNLYENFLPKCVLACLFKSIRQALECVNVSLYPVFTQDKIKHLTMLINSAETAEMPPHLTTNFRLALLTKSENMDAKALKKFGILPQLEPSFDCRLTVRDHKKSNLKQSLRRKVAKEKRGAMRDIRKDAQCLASHQLMSIKENDLIREKKTKAILNSIRSIED